VRVERIGALVERRSGRQQLVVQIDAAVVLPEERRIVAVRLSLADAAEVYVLPPAFATPGAAVTMPLRRDELTGYDCVWVEPISMDAALRDELRGWYYIKRRFVENEVGQRFYFDFYGAKWLAFPNGPGNI